MADHVRIMFLAERPDLIPLVAAWGFAEWGHLDPRQTLQSREAALHAELGRGPIPTTWVALDADGSALGTAALILDDMVGDPHNPWLASVYVRPDRRGQGIATSLVRTVERQARKLGVAELFLFTSSAPRLYAGLGWRTFLETCDYRGEQVTVMSRDLEDVRG